MARKAREKSATGIYAVLITGADKSRKLFYDDEDYGEFISRLYDRLEGSLLAFALCENAVCLISKEEDRGIGWTVKPVTTSYARYYGSRYDIDGGLFERRFKSMPIETAQDMATALACVHRLCEDIGTEGYTGLYEGDELVIPPQAMDILGDISLYNKAMQSGNAIIPFFAPLTGARSERKPPAKKAAQKKAVKKSEPVREEPAKEEPVVKKKKKNMPSWLL